MVEQADRAVDDAFKLVEIHHGFHRIELIAQNMYKHLPIVSVHRLHRPVRQFQGVGGVEDAIDLDFVQGRYPRVVGEVYPRIAARYRRAQSADISRMTATTTPAVPGAAPGVCTQMNVPVNDAPLMLSISGMRGLVGRSLTPPVAARYGAAVGSWLREITEVDAPHVVIGRDSRPSGQSIGASVVAGLAAVGCRVTDLGIVTTPTTAIMIGRAGADGGVVVTASHNPIEWNGIKTLRADGVAPPPDQAGQIIERFKHDDLDWVDVDRIQPLARDDCGNDTHVAMLIERMDVEAIRQRKLKVVLDSVHGAGGPATAQLLAALGVECMHLYGEPTGRFPHMPEPTEENLRGLGAAVTEHGADLGLAQDPDADRLAIVDEAGRYIGEEYTLALTAYHVLSREPGAAVANLSTSRMIDDIAALCGGAVHRSAVGEANVADVMRQVGAVIGGEGNGGIMWPDMIHVRDSLSGIALVLELLAHSGLRISQLTEKFPRYTILKSKLPIAEGMAERAIEQLSARYADQQIDLQDGIRIDWPSAWAHVRPSNTEPILRIIAEASDRATAEQLVGEVRATMDGA